MHFAKILSAQNHLLKAHIISVEVDISRGLHTFSIVGLPDKAVEEARDRVSAAIKNSGFKSPKQTNAKITVSLAPAHIRKEGPSFDLPIALGYLLASDEIEFDPQSKMFIGELSLDGKVRPVHGVLSYTRIALENNIKEIFVPSDNAREASLIKGIKVYGINSLDQAIKHLCSVVKIIATPTYTPKLFNIEFPVNLDDVVGQEQAKRGLIIAGAGKHNIALYGPPGTGKTMLARALQSILPPLSFGEILEVTEIYSVAGYLNDNLITHPPVRSPHHTSSYVSLIGGGSTPRPGEATLAHRGILFLDEFPEFEKRVIESLRQPLEDKVISISRSRNSVKFPASFILVAALNPCSCGNKGIKGKNCICSAKDLSRYSRKISGPIIDRIDIWIEVSKVDHEKLMRKNTDENKSNKTNEARKIIASAKEIQNKRFDSEILYNSNVSARDMAKFMNMSKEAEDSINAAAKIYDLSGRGYHRTIKLARTIADLEGNSEIKTPHIMEALQYRQKYFKNN